MDSPGNNIDKSPLETNVAAIMVKTLVNFPEDKSALVAGFNTDGWVKTKILSKLSRTSDFPLDGLYVRTEFTGYEFYQGLDSSGGNITQRSDLIDNVPPLISASNAYSNSAGFNTDGWIKSTMRVPPPDSPPAFKVPTKGSYVRLQLPGFVFLPMLDSPGNNARQLTGKQVWELVEAARADNKIVAFDTNGWLKTALVDVPVEVDIEKYPLFGLYVKQPDSTELASTNAVTTNGNLTLFLFVLRATALIWGKWFLSDSNVRAEYDKAVSAGSQEILQQVKDGQISPQEAVKQAIDMRNTYLYDMRKKTSPIGLIVAQAIKPTGLSYDALLNKYANIRFHKTFAELTAEQASQVAVDTIDSAGRANKGITERMQRIGYASRSLIIIAAAVSIYRVVVADDWKEEMGNQVATWSGAIVLGKLGSGVGALVGPIGAILGALIGGVIGGLGGAKMLELARWFFGGKSSNSAAEILGPTLLAAASVAVEKRLSASGQNFYIHQVLSSHVSEEHRAGVAAADIAEDMVATESVIRVEVEVTQPANQSRSPVVLTLLL